MPKMPPDTDGKRPKNDDKEPQLSGDEAGEILRTLKPAKPEDRLPEGTTIIRFIPHLGRRDKKQRWARIVGT